jgi:hypothetical protein
MFDEELEKRFVKNYPEFCHNGKPLSPYYDFWEAGAEFGHNNANEWHYVKDKLPETSGKYLVYTGGDPFVLEFDTDYNAFGYWVASLGDDWGVRDIDFETVKDRGEDEVIAWKEIILPNIE